MVTRIRKHTRPHLYMREHRKARGLSAPQVAERMEIERESLLRLERQSWRVKLEDQVAFAVAIGLEPEEYQLLASPPGTPSLDGLVAGAPKEVRAMAFDVISQMVKKRG